MSTLENPSMIAQRHNMDQAHVNKLLLKSGIKPEYELKSGRGMMRLYDIEAADKVIAVHKAKMAEKQVTKAPTPTPAPVVAAPSEVLDMLEALTESVAKLMEQNTVMFRALSSKLDALQKQQELAQEAVVELATRPTESPAPEPAPAPTQRRRPRVRVLGLHDNKTDHIQREFGKLLDLAFVNPDRALAAAQSPGTADATLVMADFTNHQVTNTLSANGVPYTPVRGGLTALRSRLAELAAA